MIVLIALLLIAVIIIFCLSVSLSRKTKLLKKYQAASATSSERNIENGSVVTTVCRENEALTMATH